MLNLDVSADERARCLHRVVRAMHDGSCPSCAFLAPADEFVYSGGHKCPNCGFHITAEQEAKAPGCRQRRSLAVFEEWRAVQK